MKKTIRLSICLIITTIILMSTSSFAAWWGTPGYEWALSKNLTSIKTQAQLNRPVTLSDYYNIILKYLQMKNVRPSGRTVQSLTLGEIYNGTISGLIKDLNQQISKEVLTPQEYRVVSDLTQHAKQIVAEQSTHLYRDDLKNLNLYLDLVRYRAATLLTEDTKIKREYKSSVLYELRNTKYAKSIEYGIMPINGNDISRQSFLILMHNLLSNSTSTAENIIKSFNDAGVLIGYDDSLWLRKDITYSELFAFLYRFEAYDFGTSIGTGESDEG